jgi:TonB family protein
MTLTRDAARSRLLQLSNKAAPRAVHWMAGLVLAAGVHVAVALPLLPEPEPPAPIVEPEGIEMGVDLAPLVQPPEIEAPPPPPPEIIEEEPVLQERAEDSPPPAPPAVPREIPDLPDIRPQAIPEMWRGSPGGGGVSLAEFMNLRGWLAEARAEVMRHVRYPERAAADRITGSARVIIVASADGEITQWDFVERSRHDVLNQAVSRAVNRVRRLPPFPEGTTQTFLTYTTEFRFELVMPDGSILAQSETDPAPQAAAAAPPPSNLASLADLASCASAGARIGTLRSDIMARRDALQARLADYNEDVERYQRRRESVPRRLERERDAINAESEAFNADLETFQASVPPYQAQCGSVRAAFEDFASVCAPFLQRGNLFCEAFGEYWGRLGSDVN